MEKTVIMEQKDSIAVVRLNRPKAYNAFDAITIKALRDILMTLARDESIKGVVLTGVGKAFCAGGDLRWLSSYKDNYGDAFYELAAIYHQAILEIRRMPRPVVAAINGLAAGGGLSMALACDFRIIESSAMLKQAYTSNGLSIDGGGTFMLPRIVGMGRAMEIAVFDPDISAEKALELGLVTEVVEDGQAVDTAVELVRQITNGAHCSFRASKELINESFNRSLEAQLEQERRWLVSCAEHPHGQEGIRAFLEKRKPEFV